MVWLALIVGNSRFHWALFTEEVLRKRWDTPPLSTPQLKELQNHGFIGEIWEKLQISHPEDLYSLVENSLGLWLASVVQTVTDDLISYPHLTIVQRAQIPVEDLYEAIGVDRALTLFGAGHIYGWPILVIDCGTALTFTAGQVNPASGRGRLLGGAILPGLGLQFRALHDYTDQLPRLDPQELVWPQRWARTTEDAIASGIFRTYLAGIQDFLQAWHQEYPTGRVILTGGDGAKTAELLKHDAPSFAPSIQTDPDLMFWGLKAYRQAWIKGH